LLRGADGAPRSPFSGTDPLSPAQTRAFMIADNRLTEIATWDDRLLAQQLKDLSLLGLDFSLELTGFEMPEIDLRIASLDDVPEGADDPADVLPAAAVGPPLSHIGDLWVLGRHRVFCGNALDPTAFAALIGEEHAAMVFTDPPYNVPIEGHASGLGATHHRPMASGGWTGANSLPFSARLCVTSPRSAAMARSTSSASTGAISRSCWPPAATPMAS
jgi:hypothetical protein